MSASRWRWPRKSRWSSSVADSARKALMFGLFLSGFLPAMLAYAVAVGSLMVVASSGGSCVIVAGLAVFGPDFGGAPRLSGRPGRPPEAILARRLCD